jgi:hypothetical protein
MKRSAILLIAAIALFILSPEAHAKKKPPVDVDPPQNWTTTPGVVAQGSPASHGIAAASANPVPSVGCPSADLPANVETVVAEGMAKAPASATTPIWELSTLGGVAIRNNNGSQSAVHVVSYIGVAGPGCVDFTSCKPTLTPLTVVDTVILSGFPFPWLFTWIQDTGETLAPADTAVFFVTLTPDGDLACDSASFFPTAHNQVP